MSLKCLSLVDELNNAVRYIHIEKSPMTYGCSVSYTYPPQPLMLGKVMEEFKCCGTGLTIIDTAYNRLMYSISSDDNCCNYQLRIIDSTGAHVGEFTAVYPNFF